MIESLKSKFLPTSRLAFILSLASLPLFSTILLAIINNEDIVEHLCKGPINKVCHFDNINFGDLFVSLGILWLLIFLVIILIEGYLLLKPLKLIYKYYVLTEDSFPGLSAYKKTRQCLALGEYEYVWLAARVSIECGIWSSTDHKIDEKNLIIKFIARKRSQDHMDIGDADDISEVPNCFVLTDNDKQHLIVSYLQAVAEINPKGEDKDRFLTEATIDKGFLAPQSLLEGLLAKYDQSWPPLIKRFEEEISNKQDIEGTQMFIFYCWLLWGPSIPLGHCALWKINQNNWIIALQYGFGDENNSLPIMPLINQNLDDGNYLKILNFIFTSPLAQPISLKVRPVWIASELSNRSEELKQSLRFVGDAQKLVVEDLLINNLSKSSGKLVLDYVGAPHFSKPSIKRSNPKKYYSSYVWVMFVLCEENNEPLYPPIDLETKSATNKTPWLGMYPFFEHGNIADDITYAVFKRQLAFKALASINRLLEMKTERSKDGKIRNNNFTFRYVCASDDSCCIDNNCMPTYSSSYRSSIKIKDYLNNLLGEKNIIWNHQAEGDFATNESKECGHFQDLKINVKIPIASHNWKYQPYFRACYLPEIIFNFYKAKQ